MNRYQTHQGDCVDCIKNSNLLSNLTKDNIYFNATNIRIFANEINERKSAIADFLSNSSTLIYINSLDKHSDKPLYITKRGRYGYTLMRYDLFIYFVNWCDASLVPIILNNYKGVFEDSIINMKSKVVIHMKNKENQFIDVLDTAISVQSNRIGYRQYHCLNYYIDYLIVSKLFTGENIYTIVEYDENYHNNKKQVIKDKKRIDDIKKYLLKSDTDISCIQLIRIKEGQEGYAYSYLIPYLIGLETSSSFDAICEHLYHEYIYNIEE